MEGFGNQLDVDALRQQGYDSVIGVDANGQPLEMNVFDAENIEPFFGQPTGLLETNTADIVPMRPPTERVPMSPEDAAYWLENPRGLPPEMLEEAKRANPEAYESFLRPPASTADTYEAALERGMREWSQMTDQERRRHVLGVQAQQREAEVLQRGIDPNEGLLGHMNIRSPAEEQAVSIAQAFKGSRVGDKMDVGEFHLEHIQMPSGDEYVRVVHIPTGKSLGPTVPKDLERHMTFRLENPRGWME
jgi:hypothetical protein